MILKSNGGRETFSSTFWVGIYMYTRARISAGYRKKKTRWLCYKSGSGEIKKFQTSKIKIGNSKWELIYQGRLAVGNEVSVARLPPSLKNKHPQWITP